MKILLKISLLVLLCYLLIGCGSTKTRRNAATKTTTKEVTETAIKELLNTKTEYFGDTIKGVVTLPVITAETPVNYKFESAGIALDIQLTDKTMKYQAIAKPIAKTTIHGVKEISIKKVADVKAVSEETAVTVKKPFRFPWYILITILGLAAGGYILLKNRLTIF